MLRKLRKIIIITALIIGIMELSAWAKVRWTFDIDMTGHYIEGLGDITPDVDNTYDIGSAALRWRNLYVGTIITPYENTVVVAKAGGDFTVIQDAIDSITDAAADKRYIVLIYPGEYAETVVGEDYVSLMGMGTKKGEVVITGTSGTLFTFPAASGIHVDRIKFVAEPTASGMIIFQATAGTHGVRQCWLEMSSATNGITGRLLDMDGGNFYIRSTILDYDFDGTAGGANTHSIIHINGNSLFNIFDSIMEFNIDDVDDIVVGIDEATTGTVETYITGNQKIHLTLNHVAYAGSCGFYYAHGAGVNKNVQGNHIHLSTAGNGTAYAYYQDTTGGGGQIHATANRVIVEGFTNNYYANIANLDTLVSHFDDVIAPTGTVGAGAFDYVYSTADGDLEASGQIVADEVGIGTTTIPHGAVGYADLALEGANASADGPHVQITTASDDYPLLQILGWQHDSVDLAFDAYYDGAWRSSDADSNFRISKGDTADMFKIGYDSGIAQGVAVTWNDGVVIDISGKVFLNETINTNASGPSLTINQGTEDDLILAEKSDDVAHGITTRVETDTYGFDGKTEGASGGRFIVGVKDADGDPDGALKLDGWLGENADTGLSTTDHGVVRISSAIKSGTDIAALNDEGNLLSIEDFGTSVYIIDEDGDFWAYGGGHLNAAGADTDTQIEGDTDTFLIYADASADRVGMGFAAPTSKLDVNGAIAAGGSALITFSTGGGTIATSADGDLSFSPDDEGNILITNGVIINRDYCWGEDFDDEITAVQFEAGLVADFWVTAGLNYAAANVTYTEGPGGTLQAITAGGNDDSVTAVGALNFRPDNNPIVEARFMIHDIATTYVAVGLVEQSYQDKAAPDDDICVVGFDTDNAHGFGVDQLLLFTNDAAGGLITSDLGVAIVADTYVKIRFDLTDPEQPRVWINDTEISDLLITGTVQAGISMAPYFMVQSLSGVADTFTMDYIKGWQDR